MARSLRIPACHLGYVKRLRRQGLGFFFLFEGAAPLVISGVQLFLGAAQILSRLGFVFLFEVADFPVSQDDRGVIPQVRSRALFNSSSEPAAEKSAFAASTARAIPS